ncbi:MAG: hypothetical protein BWX79_02790 [Alphaproteobacteria bacterium ADurb.Bin100]|nr:MAG: hypothetical protein BWX79_02790 [Alphaproteobacteria bacterium ADurb.Bin100]
MARRSTIMPSLVTRARAYCPTKLATPRSPNKPIRPMGTIHSGIFPLLNPWSRRYFNKAGIMGSVAAATSEASKATPQMWRCWPK